MATIAWIEADGGSYESKLNYLLSQTDGLLCNGDVMWHTGKGNIAFKLDNVSGLTMTNSGVENVENRAPIGSLECMYTENERMAGATYPGFSGADCRGISIAGSRNVNLHNVYAKEVTSYGGSAWGIDVHTDSTDVKIRNAYIHDVQGGANEDAQSYNDCKDKPNPNKLPSATGLNIRPDTSDVCYGNLHIEEIFSINDNHAALNDYQHHDGYQDQSGYQGQNPGYTGYQPTDHYSNDAYGNDGYGSDYGNSGYGNTSYGSGYDDGQAYGHDGYPSGYGAGYPQDQPGYGGYP